VFTGTLPDLSRELREASC